MILVVVLAVVLAVGVTVAIAASDVEFRHLVPFHIIHFIRRLL